MFYIYLQVADLLIANLLNIGSIHVKSEKQHTAWNF